MTRVLIVEDEALIAMLIEDAVEGAGATVAARASNIQDAARCVMTGDFDVALLDVNLGGQKAHALPAMLKRLGKPFAFVTGYGDAGILGAYADAPVINKPFLGAEIGKVLAHLAGRSVASGRLECSGPASIQPTPFQRGAGP